MTLASLLSMPEIVLSQDNINNLLTSKNLLNILKATFVHPSKDPFLSFCSLLTFGKNASSPNKKIRKAARVEIFGKIAYETFPIKNHANIKLSYLEIATGLQSFSERWQQYTFDEILSVVMVIDVNK